MSDHGSLAQEPRKTPRFVHPNLGPATASGTPEPQVTPGFSLHQELEMLVESGLPPAAVLRAATLTNATVLGEQERLGSLSAGKTADLVLLTANPLDDIRNTRRLELVIHMGQVCRPDALLKLVPRE